jgi:predicted membrane chloride channel (bestrophin family)
MIPYEKSFLNINLIFRVHGSPIWRAFLPAIISTALFFVLELYFVEDLNLEHPYAVGVLISSVSFLFVFRANAGYNRYWSACGDVHHFMSKWLDAITHCGIYHMQQSHYEHMKPPSYYDNHDLNIYGLSRDREQEKPLINRRGKAYRKVRSKEKSINKVVGREESFDSVRLMKSTSTTTDVPSCLMAKGRLDGGWGLMFDDDTSTYYSMKEPHTWDMDSKKGFASSVGGRTPSLFLQELVHLMSLCNAVACSTLRNDMEGAEAPLDLYSPGSPWPEVDPDAEGRSWKRALWEAIRYMGGVDRTIAQRTQHNSRRPLAVLGGVSDNEILFLQKARGASAKVNLAWSWLSEFIIREHLNGSLGNVGPPIVSRIFQFLSDGMIFYNHARKTMFIPFPFPHAQISAYFVVVIMVAVPLLMDEYSNNLYLGAFLTFLTVTCLAGLHEVARELENPFRNVPNEIPLCTLQAMFNESLITLYSGYHPDHYWNGQEYRNKYYDTIHENEPQAPSTKSGNNIKPS